MSQVHSSWPEQASAAIKAQFPQYSPRLGVVLGSGLGRFADELTDRVSIAYDDLPGFPQIAVYGHRGMLVLGRLHGVDIVCLQGRAHSYEGHSQSVVKNYVRTLKRLGCEYFFAISACGSLRSDVGPGELMLINDHINLQPGNPLIGPNDDEFGPRFYALDNAYDAATRELLHAAAREVSVPLHEGVYIAVSGPNYETAAEIRAFRQWGADAVGMSTVPEVLVAVHCGMKVAVIAAITNFATGLAHESHSHEAVVQMAQKSSENVSRLMNQFIRMNL